MSKVTIEDPVESGEKSCDGQGRLYLGAGYEGKTIKYFIEEVEEDSDNKDDSYQ